MFVAYFLTVHKSPNQLERLINCLNTQLCDIYLHVDLKTNIEEFKNLTKFTNVYFVKKRVDVIWGGYSQVQATINGLEEIISCNKNYNFINFISGQDYPIKPLNQFYAFLSQHKNNEFIEYIHESERYEVTKSRIYKYNFNEFNIKGKYLIQKLANMILPEKKFPLKNYEIVWKANWFILSKDAVSYVLKFLKENPEVVQFFKYGWGVDEFVFQTILYNSEFKEKIINRNYRFVDWSAQEASPKTFRLEDFDKLVNTDDFFARKFDQDLDSTILDQIDQKLLN